MSRGASAANRHVATATTLVFYERTKKISCLVFEIIDYIYEHPNASCRFVADALGIASHLSVWHVLRKKNLHPFRYQTVQGLTPTDHNPRVQFSRWMLNHVREDRDFSSYILFMDEAQFTQEGVLNQHA